MNCNPIYRIAMACFIEGLEPASLALSPHQLAQAEACITELWGDSESDTYYRCLMALSREDETE